MVLGMSKRNHAVAWDDVTDGLAHYRDQGQELYEAGRRRAERLYDEGLHRAGDVYGEGRRRAYAATDALAGKRGYDTSTLLMAAAVGAVAGAAIMWALTRLSAKPDTIHEAADDFSIYDDDELDNGV